MMTHCLVGKSKRKTEASIVGLLLIMIGRSSSSWRSLVETMSRLERTSSCATTRRRERRRKSNSQNAIFDYPTRRDCARQAKFQAKTSFFNTKGIILRKEQYQDRRDVAEESKQEENQSSILSLEHYWSISWTGGMLDMVDASRCSIELFGWTFA